MESYTTSSSINVKLASDEELSIIVAAGPYMSNGTVLTNNINNLLDKVIEKKAHVLILVRLTFLQKKVYYQSNLNNCFSKKINS